MSATFKYCLLILLLFAVVTVPAQDAPEGRFLETAAYDMVKIDDQWQVEDAFEVPFKDKLPFVTFALRIYHPGFGAISVDLAYSADGINFSDFRPVGFEVHQPNPDFKVLELQFLEPGDEFVRYRIRTENGGRLPVEVHWYDPPNEFTLEEKTLPDPVNRTSCELPSYITRTGWNCPTGQDYSVGDPSYTNVSHMVVHHSAGSNSSSDWAAVVLSIWNYHRHTNGWSDIGYNFLIDPNGVIYEGRGGNDGYALDVLPAATCGSNSGTMAVCMLGNYNTVDFPAIASFSLESLLAWKSTDNSIDPAGSSSLNSYGVLEHIFGHRQGCSTECPGDNLYAELPRIRTDVADQVLSLCNDNCEPEASFTANPQDGPAPLVVQFTNTSVNAQTYEWNFPGGTPAATSDEHPVVTYTNPGTYDVMLTAYNECGSHDTVYTDLINAQLINTIPENNLIAGMHPNPVSTYLQIDFEQQLHRAHIELFNIAGQTVYHKRHSGMNAAIPMEKMASGMYIIKVTDTANDMIWTGKVEKD